MFCPINNMLFMGQNTHPDLLFSYIMTYTTCISISNLIACTPSDGTSGRPVCTQSGYSFTARHNLPSGMERSQTIF